MGKTSGYLALASGLAGGADVIVTPEFDIEPAEVEQQLAAAHARGKRYALAVVTDGAHNNAQRCMEYFRAREEEIGYELRVTILGHVQRGGAPTSFRPDPGQPSGRGGRGADRGWQQRSAGRMDRRRDCLYAS